jgi:putative aldouronate transport system substrate-binding protein
MSAPSALGGHAVSRRAVLRGLGGLAVAAAPGLSLAACGGGDKSTGSSSTIEVMAPVSTPTAGPPPADWFWYKLVKDATGLDVKLNLVTDATQYYVKLQARAAANDLPDVFLTQATTQSQLATQGLVAEWTPLLSKMPNYVREHDVDRFKPVGTFSGKLYGLTTRNWFPYKQVVVIRQDWLDKLGLQVPRTLDEYLTVIKAFASGDPDGNGKKDTYGWSAAVNPDGGIIGLDPFFGAFDALAGWPGPPQAPWRKDGDKLTHIVTTENFRAALQFIHELDASGAIDPDWKAQKGEDLRTKFQAGKVGLLQYDWSGALSPNDYVNFHKANPKGVLKIIDPPVGRGGAQAASYYTAAGNMFGISKRAADSGKGEAIAKWLDWLAGDGYLPTVAGEEGADKGYTKAADGSLQLSYANPDYPKFRQLNTFALKGTSDEFVMRYVGKTTQGDGSVFDLADWLRNGLPKYPRKDVTAVAAAPPPPADVAADLARTLNEGVFKFATGARPFSQWSQFVGEVNAAGLDKWTEEATKRVNEVGTL